MSRGMCTVHHLKGFHSKYSSLYSANIKKSNSSIRHPASAIPFSHIACISDYDDNSSYTKTHGICAGSRHNVPFLAFDSNFSRRLSTGQQRFEAAGGPPPSPPDGTSGGHTSAGGGGNNDRLVCPKCGSPCEHVNAFVASTRYNVQ